MVNRTILMRIQTGKVASWPWWRTWKTWICFWTVFWGYKSYPEKINQEATRHRRRQKVIAPHSNTSVAEDKWLSEIATYVSMYARREIENQGWASHLEEPTLKRKMDKYSWPHNWDANCAESKPRNLVQTERFDSRFTPEIGKLTLLNGRKE